MSREQEERLKSMIYDVIIIGAGVSGCAAARELSRYDLKILVAESMEDVCCGTSKANSAIVHAGYDAKPGTLMAKLNVEGNRMMDQVCRELDVPFERIGSLVVCRSDEDKSVLERLLQQGEENGVPDLRIVGREELKEMEPNITDETQWALYAPTGGIVCPFTLTCAYAENAAANGVEFQFDTRVEKIYPEETADGRLFRLETTGGELLSRVVVNAAGVYADQLHNQVSEEKLHITPRRGSYDLMDKKAGGHVRHVIFPLPSDKGKGTLVTPTVHGNLLIGPTAVDIEDPEGTNTTAEELGAVVQTSGKYIADIPYRETITSFAGLRAHEDGHEFRIGEVKDCPGFVDCAGIESPGLTSAPAIGVMVAECVAKILSPAQNEQFDPVREGLLDPKTMTPEAYRELVRQDPSYGSIVCRCESVTEGEIIDAIRRIPGARSLDGVKRRTRAGMGRCQAGFCSPRVMEILARELGIPLEEVTKSGGASRIIVGRDKLLIKEGQR